MFVWIVGVVLCAGVRRTLAMHLQHYSCEEFEVGAYFDPYEAIDSLWKIFYSWSETTEINPIIFHLPIKENLKKFRETIEAIDPTLQVEWQKATLFMQPRAGVMILFLYSGTPGAFRALITINSREKERPRRPPEVKFADVRMKIVDRFLGMMCCEDMTAFALARIDELPVTDAQCERGAAKLGFQGPGGRSYIFLHNLTREEL